MSTVRGVQSKQQIATHHSVDVIWSFGLLTSYARGSMDQPFGKELVSAFQFASFSRKQLKIWL